MAAPSDTRSQEWAWWHQGAQDEAEAREVLRRSTGPAVKDLLDVLEALGQRDRLTAGQAVAQAWPVWASDLDRASRRSIRRAVRRGAWPWSLLTRLRYRRLLP